MRDLTSSITDTISSIVLAWAKSKVVIDIGLLFTEKDLLSRPTTTGKPTEASPTSSKVLSNSGSIPVIFSMAPCNVAATWYEKKQMSCGQKLK